MFLLLPCSHIVDALVQVAIRVRRVELAKQLAADNVQIEGELRQVGLAIPNDL